MSQKEIKDMAASVRERLFNLSKERGEGFGFLLTRYAIERLLYRLSKSEFKDRLILKGATLFSVWTEKFHRPTRDVDFLGYGDPSQIEWLKVFKSVCTVEVKPDGIIFDAESLRIEEIREGQWYNGQRIRLQAKLARAQIDVQVDIGFGDSVTPQAEVIDFPTFLDMPAPALKAYPQETFIAEKLHAMVTHGIANSRMRDYYDLWYMGDIFTFKGMALAEAIRKTFQRRSTEIEPTMPTGLSDEFVTLHEADWRGFLKASKLEDAKISLQGVVELLRVFLLPPMQAAAKQRELDRKWDKRSWK